jgi:hypothetical protein
MPYNAGKKGVLNQPAATADSKSAQGYYGVKDTFLYGKANEYPGFASTTLALTDYTYFYDYNNTELQASGLITKTYGSGVTNSAVDGITGDTNALDTNASANTDKTIRWDFSFNGTSDIVLVGMRVNGKAGATYGLHANDNGNYISIVTSANVGYIYGTGTFRGSTTMTSGTENKWCVYVFGGGTNSATVDDTTSSGLRIFQANIGGGTTLGSEVTKGSTSSGYSGAYKTGQGVQVASGGSPSGLTIGYPRNAMGWHIKGMAFVKSFSATSDYDTIVGDFHNRMFNP